MRIFVFSVVMLVQTLMFSEIVCAQQSNIAKQRLIVDEAISTIEDYESFATISDEEIRYFFEDLFVDENVKVYNDLLGVSTAESLSVKEYCQKMSEDLRNKKVTIKNIKKEKIWNENDSWKIKFSFDKTLSYVNKCGTYISSNDFYDKEYHLLVTLVYDEQQEKCKIESITGSVDSSKKLSADFYTFRTEDKRDYQLAYRNNKLSFNSYGQAILDGPFAKTAFHYADPDVVLMPIVEEECKSVSMKYKERKLRIKLHYDLELGNFWEIGGKESLNDTKTTMSSFGVDFGYVFPSKSKVKIGMFTGLNLSLATIKMSYQNEDYSYSSSADVDGDSYIRHYEKLLLDQNAKLTEFGIPIYADMNVKFNRLLSLYIDLGIKFNYSISHKVNELEGEAYIYGIYPQYNDLRMDEHWGYNGFGHNIFSNLNLDNTNLTNMRDLNVDALGGAGLRFSIPRTALSLDFGIAYQLGLMNLLKSESDNGITQIVYNSITDGASTEHVGSLFDFFSNIKKRALNFNIGLIYNF